MEGPSSNREVENRFISVLPADYHPTVHKKSEKSRQKAFTVTNPYEVKQLAVYLPKSDLKPKGLYKDDISSKQYQSLEAIPDIGQFEEFKVTDRHSKNVRDKKEHRRGRQILEKNKQPNERFSRKFFSEEKYHYSQNLQIEVELRQFKKEIEMRFSKSSMNQSYNFPRKKSSIVIAGLKDPKGDSTKIQALQGRQNSLESLDKKYNTSYKKLYQTSNYNTIQLGNDSKGTCFNLKFNKFVQILVFNDNKFRSISFSRTTSFSV